MFKTENDKDMNIEVKENIFQKGILLNRRKKESRLVHRSHEIKEEIEKEKKKQYSSLSLPMRPLIFAFHEMIQNAVSEKRTVVKGPD